MVVPELITKARGMRTMDAIVGAAGNKFSKASLSSWEAGSRRPVVANQIVLCDALGVKFEKISLPIDEIPADSKFFVK